MTYCVSVCLNSGLVFCSDSRTNAGPDMISTYSKMHIFNHRKDRLFVVLSAGNLATTQAIVNRLRRDIEDEATRSLYTVSKMVDAAQYVGEISREEQTKASSAMAGTNVDTSATLIFGGQIKGTEPTIYLIYAAGNFISCSQHSPYLQIGESKYGKPILDRILTRGTSIADAARCAIVSMDSTLRANATVGPPIEVLIYERDTFEADHYIRMDEDDDYLRAIKQAWNEKIKQAFLDLPTFDWEERSLGQDTGPVETGVGAC
ncbi:MAG: proteasome-type protease [Thiotrichales bacterium]